MKLSVVFLVVVGIMLQADFINGGRLFRLINLNFSYYKKLNVAKCLIKTF